MYGGGLKTADGGTADLEVQQLCPEVVAEVMVNVSLWVDGPVGEGGKKDEKKKKLKNEKKNF